MGFQLAAAYVQLEQKGYSGLMSKIGKVEGSLNKMTKAADGPLAKAIRESGNEVGRLTSLSGAAVQSMREIGDEVGINTTQLAEFADVSADIRDTFADVKVRMESLREKTESFASVGGKADGKLLGMVGKAGRLLGIVGLVAGAAKGVYDWVYKWSLEASGFNDEMERALRLENELAEQRGRITSDAISKAARIANEDQRRIELQKMLKKALLENDQAQQDMRARDEERTPGFFGQFADGKLNEELEPAFERAKAKAEATAASVKALREELRGLGKGKLDFQSGLAEELKEERILLEQGAEALRAYQLEKRGFSKKAAAGFAAAETEVADAAARRANEESIADAFKRQTDELKLRNIEIVKGAEAAQRERDRMAGYTDEQAKQLAAMRAQVKASEEFAAAFDKAMRAKAEARDRRTKVRTADESPDDRSKGRSNSFQFVGLSQLADKIQQQAGANRDMKEQKEAARRTATATQQLADAARGGGLPVKMAGNNSTQIQTPDRSFKTPHIYKTRREG